MSSLLSPILQRLAGHFPIPTMARAVLERCLNPVQLDAGFETVAEGQYTRTLLFSTLFELMMQVVSRQQPSIHAAYQAAHEDTNANTFILAENAGTGLSSAGVLRAQSNAAQVNFQAHGNGRTIARFGQTLASWAEFLQVQGNGLIVGTLGTKPLIFGTAAQNRLTLAGDGKIGLGGVANPSQPLQHANGAYLSAGGQWVNASSRELKEKIHELSAAEAAAALAGLQPVHFQYKAEPGEDYLGFIAEDVPDAVATQDRKGLSPMDLVAVLTKVVQEQQRTIDQLSHKIARLEQAGAAAK